LAIHNYEDKDGILQKMTAINHFNDFNVINVEDAMHENVKYVFYCGNGRVNALVNLPDVDEMKDRIKKEFIPAQSSYEQTEHKKKELAIGDPIKGKVIGIHRNQMTAFIKISSHHKCVVHRNNVSEKYVRDIGEVLKIGQPIEGKIKNIDPKRGIEITLI